MEKKQNKAGFGIYIVIVLIGVLLVLWFNRESFTTPEWGYSNFMAAMSEDNVEAVIIEQNKEIPTGTAIVQLKNGDKKRVNIDDVTEIRKMIVDSGIPLFIKDVPETNVFLSIVLPILIGIFAIAFLIMTIMNRSMNGGANGTGKVVSFGKSRAKLITHMRSVDFSKVAGLQEEKEELAQIVDFLKDPEKYNKLGARIPKGVLLVGVPGTGKTLLAKAVAGEARVPFFSISGSDFVEMFVGVGASRVRDLFDNAKKNSPCIVFIDEIDAVARRRGTGMGGGHDEREQTLNQMLVEMDGFTSNQGIIVMAATNRVDILDPAILRPGRFDRKIVVGRPDVGARREILEVHTRNKPIGDDVDLDRIAQTTIGFTGADIENLMNEAAIEAAGKGREYINQADIELAFIKVGIGAEKKSKVISDKDKKITAYHETGHAILFHVLPDVGPVHTISIIPTGVGAAGYTMPLPDKDEMFNSKGKMLQNIMVSLGGRIAEEIIFDDITTGASQDIKQATDIARSMVTRYGMSDRVGMICCEGDENEVFIGRDLAHAKNYGEGMATIIDEEVKRIIDECYAKARSIIEEHETVLHACAETLLKREKITQEEFERIFNRNLVSGNEF